VSDIIVIKQAGGDKVAVNPAPVTIIGQTLVPATNATLGGIIVGDNLTITGNGVLSAQPGGVTAFNNRTGNVSLTSNDVTSALTYTPLTSSTAYSNLSFTGTSAANPFTLKVQNANGSRHMTLLSGSSTGQVFADMQWSISNTRANGQIDVYYPFMRLFTDPLNPDTNEGKLLLQYNYTANASTGPYFNTSIQISKTKAEFFAPTYSFTDNSLLIRSYADTRYATYTQISELMAMDSSLAININSLDVRLTDLEPLVNLKLPSANFTYANLTGKPTTLAGYGITDGLTSANLTPYLTISSANATYAVLGHTHSIANVTGLQTALDAKLSSANFTYANITGKPTLANVATSGNYADLTGTPNLTVYLTTANASTTYQLLGNYATTSCLTFSNITGKPTTLSGYGISDGYSTSNPSGYITAGANSFTGTQNLQDNELFRAKLRDYSESVSSPTISSGTLTLNLETSNIFTVSLNAAITTLTISNPPASGSGGSFTLIFTADGTPRSVTWPSSIKWAGGTAPTITSTSGKVDSFAFFTSDGGTNWQGYVGGQNF